MVSARTRKDWILWGALGCALASTAHAEYTLATATHVNEYVALAVPGALDLYVIRALQQRRDVLAAVLVMVAANVTSHLLTAGVLPVHWSITAAVGALAPLLLWRVHYLWRPSADTGAGSAPVPAAPVQASEPEYPPAPDHVPASWMDDEYPETHPSAPHPGTGAVETPCPHGLPTWACPDCPHPKPSAVPYLAPVPDLPAEYAAGAVHSETPLTAADWQYVDRADRYVRDTDKPSVRGLRRAINVGQDRAERLLTHLGVLL